MRRLIRNLVLLGALAVIALVLVFSHYVNTPVTLDEDVIVTIPSGATLGQVTRQLSQEGIIQSPLYWRILARITGSANRIKAGEYRLSGSLTPGEILSMLVAGKTLQYNITIPEGWTFKQMLEAIRSKQEIRNTSDTEDAATIMEAVGEPGMNPEGRFLPETYFFTRNTPDIDILRRSHDAMKSLLQKEWDQRADGLPLKTPYEALILASIVEKETGVGDERPMIAAVFINRLDKGMKLQTDPTVIYGMGDRYKGNIRKQDLLRDTPYNTYTRKGLPPTPIALPSASSIHAVLHPADSKALYFVARGGGRHYFSNSYEEHRKAVIKYLLDGDAGRYKGDQK
jgi:UPF0755 protein